MCAGSRVELARAACDERERIAAPVETLCRSYQPTGGGAAAGASSEPNAVPNACASTDGGAARQIAICRAEITKETERELSFDRRRGGTAATAEQNWAF